MFSVLPGSFAFWLVGRLAEILGITLVLREVPLCRWKAEEWGRRERQAAPFISVWMNYFSVEVFSY